MKKSSSLRPGYSETFLTLGGRVRCRQCQAKSKRTKQQCRSPAIKGKQVCRIHGGKSTGPRTPEGRQRCAEAKTVHGNQTRAKRTAYREGMRELYELEELGRALGMIVGLRRAGRKQKG